MGTLRAEPSPRRPLDWRAEPLRHGAVSPFANKMQESFMLWTIVVILVILWALGFLALNVGGGLIHLLLVVAAIVLVYRLVTGQRVV
jgi:hypothetical protein